MVVVGIHDIAPRTLAASQALCARLDALGIGPLSLLVVPAYHGDAPLDPRGETAAWLVARARRGDEVVLHGYHHLADRAPAGLGARLRARLLSAGEGEFLALDEPTAASRLAAGVAVLDAAGLGRPAGFVAPCWLLGDPARRAAARLGFAYTTTRAAIEDLAAGVRHPAPAISLSCRTRVRTAASAVVVPWLWRASRRARVVRFALHPVDTTAPRVLGLTVDLVARTAGERRVRTYAGALSVLRGQLSAGSSRPGVSSSATGAPGIA
jgi:predicted deacetylase